MQDVTIDGIAGRIVVRYQVADSTSDLVSVDPFFRLDGGALQPLTEVVGGVIANLVASTTPSGFDFTWDTVADPAVREAILADAEVRAALHVVTEEATVLFANVGLGSSADVLVLPQLAGPCVAIKRRRCSGRRRAPLAAPPGGENRRPRRRRTKTRTHFSGATYHVAAVPSPTVFPRMALVRCLGTRVVGVAVAVSAEQALPYEIRRGAGP